MDTTASRWHGAFAFARSCAALAVAAVIAEPTPAHAADHMQRAVPMHAAPEGQVSIDELKRRYVACNRAAELGRLGSGHVAQCSLVYEELKHRAFDGDFDRLLAWSRSQR